MFQQVIQRKAYMYDEKEPTDQFIYYKGQGRTATLICPALVKGKHISTHIRTTYGRILSHQNTKKILIHQNIKKILIHQYRSTVVPQTTPISFSQVSPSSLQHSLDRGLQIQRGPQLEEELFISLKLLDIASHVTQGLK